MRLLQRAKDGDDGAYEELTATIASHFAYMIRGYGSVDPAFDREDLRQQFRLGIWQAIARVDGRGDPLFHLAWRGQQAVRSFLDVIKRRRYGTEKYVQEFGERSVGTLPEGWDPEDTRPDSDPSYALEIREGHDETHQHVVRVLASVSLTGRQEDALRWMLTVPYADAPGANKMMARALGVSPQMASQLRKKVVSQLAADDVEPERPFVCERCSRGFQTPGALTQHLNGQSGHKLCVGAVE